MDKMKKVVIKKLFILTLFIITGCESKNTSDNDDIYKMNNEYVQSGLYKGTSCIIEQWLSTAVKTKRNQGTNVKLFAYAGYDPGFSRVRKTWSYDDSRRFVLQRTIYDRKHNNISSIYFEMPDFTIDESKYLIHYKDLNDSTNNIKFLDFSFEVEDNINFNNIFVNEGRIDYTIPYIDANYNDLDNNIFYDPTRGFLYFKRKDNKIIFSESSDIFKEENGQNL